MQVAQQTLGTVLALTAEMGKPLPPEMRHKPLRDPKHGALAARRKRERQNRKAGRR